MTEKYNGWTNYETWLCNMWFDNFDFTDQMDLFYDCEDNCDVLDIIEDYIKSYVEEYVEYSISEDYGLVHDMLNALVSEIDFRDIAEHYVDDVVDELELVKDDAKSELMGVWVMKLNNVTFTINEPPIKSLLWCDKVRKAKRNKPAKINGVTHNELSPTSWLPASSLPYLKSPTNYKQMRKSSVIQFISTDVIDGRVSVLFKNGTCYRYTNVSRRAIANFNLQDNMSVGKWFNANCKQPSRVKCEKLYDAIPTPDGWAS